MADKIDKKRVFCLDANDRFMLQCQDTLMERKRKDGSSTVSFDGIRSHEEFFARMLELQASVRARHAKKEV